MQVEMSKFVCPILKNTKNLLNKILPLLVDIFKLNVHFDSQRDTATKQVSKTKIIRVILKTKGSFNVITICNFQFY